MARLDSFLRLVLEQKASDLHFHAGRVPIIRHDGDLLKLPFRNLSESEARRFLLEIMTHEQKQTLDKDQQVDFIYVLKGIGRFRANVFIQSEGIGAVFRIIPHKTPSLDDLFIPRIVKQLIKSPNGLLLVTGPTGSGKTTTLAAIVAEINKTMQRHVITIEDPIEFVHELEESVITQRQVGEHVESFAAGLRSALRESPDILVVGEMRDLETMNLALSAAETGVLVIGTLHTNSASKAIDRVVDMFEEEARDQIRGVLSVMLRGVIAQHLCKKSNGEGRIAATEVLINNYAIAHMIRDKKVHQIDGILQSSNNDGSGRQSLDSCLFRFIKEGLIALEEALKVANYPVLLEKQVSELPEDL